MIYKRLYHISRFALRRARVSAAAALVLMAASAVLFGLAPLALKFGVDLATAAKPGSVGNHALWTLSLGAVIYAAMVGFARILQAAFIPLFARVELSVTNAIAAAAYEHILYGPYELLTSRNTNETVETISDGLKGARTIFVSVFYILVPTVLEITTIATILIIHFDFLTTILYLTFVAAYGLVFQKATRGQREAIRAATHVDYERSGSLADSLANLEQIKIYQAEQARLSKLAWLGQQRCSAWTRSYRLRARNSLNLAVVHSLFVVSILTVAVARIAGGKSSAGDLVVLVMYLAQLTQTVERIAGMMGQLLVSYTHLARLMNLMDFQKETELDQGTLELPERAALSVRFSDVTFGYPDGPPVLHAVTFTIDPASRVAIVGASGSGKSTIAKLLMRFYEVQRGTISVGGIALQDIPLSSLRSQITIVSQDTVLFPDTILENVAIAMAEPDLQVIEKAARVTGLDAVVDQLPSGWQTLVGERGAKLSGGERQKVALTRALIREARIIVFDEATSSLDLKSERLFLDRFSSYFPGKTVIFIAHRLTAIVDVDEIIVLDKGRLVERGRHGELINLGGTYYTLWCSQTADKTDGVLSGHYSPAETVAPAFPAHIGARPLAEKE